ncbi:glycosyltransferase [Planctomycetota bacterium]
MEKIIDQHISVTQVFQSTALVRGGPAYTVPALCRGLMRKGCNVQVLTTDYYGFKEDSLIGMNYQVLPMKIIPFTRFRFAAGIKRAVTEKLYQSDILHINEIWLSHYHTAARIADSNKTPYLYSIRGALQPWCFRRKAWKKKPAWILYQRNDLERATCLHATVRREYDSIRQLGIKTAVAIIPNGVDQPMDSDGKGRQRIEEIWPALKNKRILLFLSRINLTKGCDYLAEAWSTIAKTYPEWHLVVAGPDQGPGREMKKTFQRAGIESHVTFTGGVFGKGKWDLIHACELYVLPTNSENFGVAVAEAMISGKPVLTTVGCPIEEIDHAGCGWRIPIGSKSLTEKLEEVLPYTADNLKNIGAVGTQVAKEKFSWDAIANDMLSVYKWMMGKAEKPNCVYLD